MHQTIIWMQVLSNLEWENYKRWKNPTTYWSYRNLSQQNRFLLEAFCVYMFSSWCQFTNSYKPTTVETLHYTTFHYSTFDAPGPFINYEKLWKAVKSCEKLYISAAAYQQMLHLCSRWKCSIEDWSLTVTGPMCTLCTSIISSNWTQKVLTVESI